MHDITYLQSHYKKYRDIKIQKVFTSKKNAVAYVLYQGKPRILKWYAPGFKNNIATEVKVLTKATLKLSIPTLFEYDSTHHVLNLSYIPGQNICDLINSPEATYSEKERLIKLLAQWFAGFHQFFKTRESFLIRGDATLRNFLFTDRIWGVDFEETRPGKPIEDIADLCTSLLTTKPMATEEKFSFCTTFITAYKQHVSWNLEHLIEELTYAIIQRIPYRPTEEQQLRKLAANIQSNPQILLQ
jgi:tRNA A-37 threonylcarbamoyl transferase component Bud32